MPEANRAGSTAPPILSRHLVMFLDFLGISEGARTWNDDRIARFIPLLQSLARSRAPFSIDGHAQDDGSYKFEVQPEISSFSDCIVASYPIIDDVPLSPADQMTMYLDMASGLVAQIAHHALNMSVLVRGGITLGRLHHSDGVVFGPAMVDAYRLESSVANYPRIVISPGAISHRSDLDVLTEKRAASLLQDADGIWHLNYFAKILRDTLTEADRGRTFALASAHIERTASEFEKAGRLSESAKWKWFHSHYLRFAGPK